jgi:predicted aldo/keto reductase-like oxidoreductase
MAMLKPGPVQYRRFGRTELAMPVLSCGGMRYQFKWQDTALADIPPDNQANLEATIHRALELGINHIETARGYGTSEMQLGRLLPRLPRSKMIVQTKVAPQADPAEFLKIFDRSMNYLGLEYVDLLSLHGINNRQLLDWSLKKNGCLAAARRLQKEGRVRFVGFSTHATTDIILEAVQSGEFDYVNLHWYFVNHLNWPAIVAARQLDMGVFIISPNDKGGKLYEPPPKLVELCAPLTPMQFNDLYCLARPEVHTLSCGAARPQDFDEHVRGLEHYDRAAEVIAPIERRLRAEMERALGAGLVSIMVQRDCRSTSTFPARSTSWKSSVSGPTPNPWTWWAGAKCAIICWARPTIGFPAKTPARLMMKNSVPPFAQSPIPRPHPGHPARSPRAALRQTQKLADARAGVADENGVVKPDFDAGGVAAIDAGPTGRSGNGTARAPELDKDGHVNLRCKRIRCPPPAGHRRPAARRN